MKKLKFEIKLQNKKHLVTIAYQNLSFPLFAIRGYKCRFLGIYWYPITIKSGGLEPKECTDWSYEQFKKYATEELCKSIKTDTETQEGIDNFKNIVKIR